MKYKICDYIKKPLRNGEWCNRECEKENQKPRFCRDCEYSTIHSQDRSSGYSVAFKVDGDQSKVYAICQKRRNHDGNEID